MKEILKNYITVISKKYCCFEGRASNQEFWHFILVDTVVSVILGICPPAAIIYGLATLLPSLGVTVRRLHDTDKTGKLLLASIPLIGQIYIFIQLFSEGTKGKNQFGLPTTESAPNKNNTVEENKDTSVE